MKMLTEAEYTALVERAKNAEKRCTFLYTMCCEAQDMNSRYGTALFEISQHCGKPSATAATALLGGDRETIVAAKALVSVAKQRGLVLTIEQRPLQPLAMGNYETVVDVRPARVRS